MKEDYVSAKKTFIGIAIFTIVAVMITTIIINSSLTNNTRKNEENNTINKEKVIGTKNNQKYNQNDLKFVKTKIQDDGLEYTSIRISGLKNKNVENKINEDIEKEEQNLKQLILKSEIGEYDSKYLVEYENANFSNVLSLFICGSKYGSNFRNNLNEFRYLNYDLTTGDRLELEDLFLPGTNIDIYAQNSIYESLMKEKFSEKNIFFNPEYWEDGRCTYVMNEIDELEFIKEFNIYKSTPKVFYFTYSYVAITYGEDYDKTLYIDFKDCLNDVVIFDKYVTSESIFESDDIGIKNLYVCSDVAVADGSYALVDDVTSNFRIDARVTSLVEEGIVKSEKYASTFEEIKKDINNRKEEIREKAIKNNDKYYYLAMGISINNFIPKYYCTYSEKDINYENFYVYTEEVLYEIDKKDFDDWFEDKLISSCRFEGYYEDAEKYMNIALSDEEKNKCKIDRKYSSIAYSINSEKVYKDLTDLFKEDSNYLSIIDNVLQREAKLSTDQIANMIKNHEYQLTAYGVNFRNEETYTLIRYEEFSVDSMKL